jgi:hypothetical protein
MATLTSVQSGNWSAASTWNLNRVPAAGDQVVISSGHTVTYDMWKEAAMKLNWARGQLVGY